MRLSISISSCVVKRTAPAMVWRWRKVCGQGLAQQRLGGAGRHLDVEAQDVVVADLERLDAGRLDVAGLERGHHLAAVVAQAARLVEVGAVAVAHEAAVAAQHAAARRRARAASIACEVAAARAPAARRCVRAPSGRPMPPPAVAQQRGAARPPRAGHRARRRDRAGRRAAGRAATWRGRCRARPAARRAASSRSGSLLEQKADRVEPRGDRVRHRAAGSASRAASSRAPGPVTVRSMAPSRLALPLARQRAQQLQARPRRRIDHEAVGRPGPPRRRAGRAACRAGSARRT